MKILQFIVYTIILNTYKFNKEELEIVENFKQGFRDTFIIGKYEIDYTIILNMNLII